MARRKKTKYEVKKPIGERQTLPGDPFEEFINAFNFAYARGEFLSYGRWEAGRYGNR